MKGGRLEFLVPDPHIVYNDAVRHSPWIRSGRLPQRDDWSTFRFAVKDVILGVATHRWNAPARRLDVRAWFVGEHPAFAEFEPTRALWAILASQAWQVGGRLAVRFEKGLPYDLRLLLEQRCGVEVSGHEEQLDEKTAHALYLACSELEVEAIERLRAEPEVSPEDVVFHTLRGTWTANQVRSMVGGRVPLRWVFAKHPDPWLETMSYLWLLRSLSLLLVEEYALARLVGRRLGVSAGRCIKRTGDLSRSLYESEERLDIEGTDLVESDSCVAVPVASPVELIPVLGIGPDDLEAELRAQVGRLPTDAEAILAVPMDWLHLSSARRTQLRVEVRAKGAWLLVIGATLNQLAREAELKLSVTAADADESDVEVDNVRRYAD